MRASVTVALCLALCLAACCGRASALDCPPAGSGMPGGFSQAEIVPEDVVNAAVTEFVDSGLGENTTWVPCDTDEMSVTATGCSQVRACATLGPKGEAACWKTGGGSRRRLGGWSSPLLPAPCLAAGGGGQQLEGAAERDVPQQRRAARPH